MNSENSNSIPIITEKDLFPHFISDFFKFFKTISFSDLLQGLRLDFKLDLDQRIDKFNPILQFAQPKDAVKIANIFREVYEGHYPYKEFEDEKEVLRMINDSKFQFVLFRDGRSKILGFFVAQFDFEERRGYIGRFVLRKKYQGEIDVMKAAISGMIVLYLIFRDKVYIWYGETRTAHDKVQFLFAACGAKPIGFLPNKDLIFDQLESIIFHIGYDERVLREYRCQEHPNLIPEAVNCFKFSDKRHNLGPFEQSNPKIKLDKKKIQIYKNRLKKSELVDKYGYRLVNYTFEDSNSYFEFLYTNHLQSIEKTKFSITCLEELNVFLGELKKFMVKENAHYFECFISANNPYHQKLFFNLGFIPRGYIPCWKYNKITNNFEDYLIFNSYSGEIDKNIKLTSESSELLGFL